MKRKYLLFSLLLAGSSFMHKNGRQYTPKPVRLPAGGGWEVLSMQPI